MTNHSRNISVDTLITNSKGEVLLVRTNKRPDTWEIPGGKLEPGETLLAGATREVKEETGLDIKIIGVAGLYNKRRL